MNQYLIIMRKQLNINGLNMSKDFLVIIFESETKYCIILINGRL